MAIGISAFQGARGKTVLILAVAVVIGLLAAWAVRDYLGDRVAEIEARSKVNTVGVVVAKQDVSAGQALTSDNLAVREVPVEWLQSSAVTPDQFDRINGQSIGFSLRAGEMLMWPMLQPGRASTFSTRLGNGRRAITLPVDEINSISGLLEPDDRIDLLITIDRDGKKFTAPLMRQVRVLATGQRSDPTADNDDPRMYSTVTLDVGVQEAPNLILAREVGKITALLRHPEDRSGLAGKALNMQSFVESPAQVSGLVKQREIPVLYGGKSERLSAADVDLPSALQGQIPKAFGID